MSDETGVQDSQRLKLVETLHEETAEKVVSIFQRQLRGDHAHAGEVGGEMVLSPDGFPYVSIRYEGEHAQTEEVSLWDIAHRRHYVIKLIESHKDALRLNTYHVAGHRLHEFLTTLDKRPGTLLEIKPFLPDTIG